MALFYRPHVWDGLKNKPKKKKKKYQRGKPKGNGPNESYGQFDDISQIQDLPPPYDEVSNQSGNGSYSTPSVQPGGYAQPYPPNKYQQETTGIPLQQKKKLSKNPCELKCPHCSVHVTTKVDYVTSKSTCVMATLLCLFGCWPCCLFTCCTSKLKDVKHLCPSCKTELGIVKRK